MDAIPKSYEYVAFEAGQMTTEQEVDFFQRLLDAGVLDSLGMRYTRRAAELIESGDVYA